MRVSRGRRWGLTGREPALSRPSAPARVPSAGSAAAAAPPPLASRVGPSARACPPAAAGGNPRCLQAWQRRRAPGTGPGLCRRSPGVVPSLGAPRSAGWYCGAGLSGGAELVQHAVPRGQGRHLPTRGAPRGGLEPLRSHRCPGRGHALADGQLGA